MSLVAKRLEGETWRQAVERIAKQFGMERDCLEEYDRHADGPDDKAAAWNALYEWDCLEFVND